MIKYYLLKILRHKIYAILKNIYILHKQYLHYVKNA